MKVAVIQFPGSNCERETLLALQRVGLSAEAVLWNGPYEALKAFSAYILIGGFSYEDRVRSGLIAAMDPLMQVLDQEAQSGKAILGICNGAQILVESGLVPGLAHKEVAMALAHNQRIKAGKLVGTGYYNDWVHIHASHVNPKHAFSSEALVQQPMYIPIAHAEGRFLLSQELYQALQQTDAVFYYYCDARGEIIPEFPINPNGASFNLAGVSNARGNILALMPHPERVVAGNPLFAALKTYLERWHQNGEQALSTVELKFTPPKLNYRPYQLVDAALHYWVGLNIHDNEAITLESSLQAQGIPLTLKRYTHWQIECAKTQNLERVATQIEESEFIFNRQKEYTLSLSELKRKGKRIYIIRPQEDELALHKTNLLQRELHLPVTKVTREQVWVVNAEEAQLTEVEAALNKRPIFGNPLAHEGYTL